jgi:hypothetical protein
MCSLVLENSEFKDKQNKTFLHKAPTENIVSQLMEPLLHPLGPLFPVPSTVIVIVLMM